MAAVLPRHLYMAIQVVVSRHWDVLLVHSCVKLLSIGHGDVQR